MAKTQRGGRENTKTIFELCQEILVEQPFAPPSRRGVFFFLFVACARYSTRRQCGALLFARVESMVPPHSTLHHFLSPQDEVRCLYWQR